MVPMGRVILMDCGYGALIVDCRCMELYILSNFRRSVWELIAGSGKVAYMYLNELFELNLGD